jgi:hypothetical protein
MYPCWAFCKMLVQIWWTTTSAHWSTIINLLTMTLINFLMITLNLIAIIFESRYHFWFAYLSLVYVCGFPSAQAYSVTCVCLWAALNCRLAQIKLPLNLSALDDSKNLQSLKNLGESLLKEKVSTLKIDAGEFHTTVNENVEIGAALDRYNEHEHISWICFVSELHTSIVITLSVIRCLRPSLH